MIKTSLPCPLRTLGLAGLLALSLGGCAGTEQRETRVLVLEGGAEDIVTTATAQGLVSFDSDGGIVPALANSWHVSDDGLSYIFRIDETTFEDGRAVDAEIVAQILTERLSDPDNRLRDSVGVIEEIEAMTDRVIEIRLTSPRPFLLQLLAQPAFAIRDGDEGTGPYRRLAGEDVDEARTDLGRLVGEDGELSEERVVVTGVDDAAAAIAQFSAGDADLVTGGTFTTLPLAREAAGLFGGPRYDPVAGLFGLLPMSSVGALAEPEVRAALNAAIDRDALVRAMGVPDLLPRATLLQAGLDIRATGTAPAFVSRPIEDRRADARALLAARSLNGASVLVDLPEGPGADILFQRLSADWGAIGLSVERAQPLGPPAHFSLVDQVAPAASAAWFLRAFRCGTRAFCSPEADELLNAARAATDRGDRARLLREAAVLMQEETLFLPLTAPVRWSLVAQSLDGFAVNRFASHPVARLRTKESR